MRKFLEAGVVVGVLLACTLVGGCSVRPLPTQALEADCLIPGHSGPAWAGSGYDRVTGVTMSNVEGGCLLKAPLPPTPILVEAQ